MFAASKRCGSSREGGGREGNLFYRLFQFGSFRSAEEGGGGKGKGRKHGYGPSMQMDLEPSPTGEARSQMIIADLRAQCRKGGERRKRTDNIR